MATDPTTSDDCYPSTEESDNCSPAVKSNALNSVKGEDRNGCEIAMDPKHRRIIVGEDGFFKQKSGSSKERIFLDLEEVLSAGFVLAKRTDGQIVAVNPGDGDKMLASLGGDVQFIDLAKGTNVFDKDILDTAETGYIPVLVCDASGDYVLKILDLASCSNLGTDSDSKLICSDSSGGGAVETPTSSANPYIHYSARQLLLDNSALTSNASGTINLQNVPDNASHVQMTMKLRTKSESTFAVARAEGSFGGILAAIAHAEDQAYGVSSDATGHDIGSVLVPITDPGGTPNVAYSVSFTSGANKEYDMTIYQDWFLVTPV